MLRGFRENGCRFVDADHFTSQWTWYQDGKESWMEEIVHARVRAASAK